MNEHLLHHTNYLFYTHTISGQDISNYYNTNLIDGQIICYIKKETSSLSYSTFLVQYQKKSPIFSDLSSILLLLIVYVQYILSSILYFLFIAQVFNVKQQNCFPSSFRSNFSAKIIPVIRSNFSAKIMPVKLYFIINASTLLWTSFYF